MFILCRIIDDIAWIEEIEQKGVSQFLNAANKNTNHHRYVIKIDIKIYTLSIHSDEASEILA